MRRYEEKDFLGVIGNRWPGRSMRPVRFGRWRDPAPPGSLLLNSGSFFLLVLLELLGLLELLLIYFRNFRTFLGFGRVK
jgi:hypothetical protein